MSSGVDPRLLEILVCPLCKGKLAYRKDAGELLSKNRQKAIQDILAQAQKLRTDLQKRAERAVKDLEERGQRIVAVIEKQGKEGVEPIVRGLNLSTRDEIEKLKKRMSQLEKRLDEIGGSKAA